MTQFETEPCSRCNGTGAYSYCQTYGSKCFKCGGNKIVLTKRGAVARAYLDELCTVSAGSLKIGDRIRVENFFRGMSYIASIISII